MKKDIHEKMKKVSEISKIPSPEINQESSRGLCTDSEFDEYKTPPQLNELKKTSKVSAFTHLETIRVENELEDNCDYDSGSHR